MIRKSVLTLFLFVLMALLLLRGWAWLREAPTPLPHDMRLVETSLGPVAVDITGNASDPTVLLIHGSAGWSGFWKDVSSGLARKGWRVVAVDVPPFGYSVHDAQARYDRTSQALRMGEVIAAVSDGPVIVVGHSFGAGAATELALRYPERVRSLILVDAALGALDPEKGDHSLAERVLSVEPVSQAAASAAITNPYALEPFLKSMLARKETAASWVPVLQQPMRREGATTAYARWLPHLFAKDDGAWSRETARLKAIQVPVSLIWGAADPVTPVAQGRRLEQLLGARNFVLLDGVGHIPHIEDPSAFGRALDSVLEPDRRSRE